MDKISVNKLVEEVKSNLPREILVLIAQNCLNKNTDIQTTIKNFENEVYKYTLKVQKKVINCTGTCRQLMYYMYCTVFVLVHVKKIPRFST